MTIFLPNLENVSFIFSIVKILIKMPQELFCEYVNCLLIHFFLLRILIGIMAVVNRNGESTFS